MLIYLLQAHIIIRLRHRHNPWLEQQKPWLSIECLPPRAWRYSFRLQLHKIELIKRAVKRADSRKDVRVSFLIDSIPVRKDTGEHAISMHKLAKDIAIGVATHPIEARAQRIPQNAMI